MLAKNTILLSILLLPPDLLSCNQSKENVPAPTCTLGLESEHPGWDPAADWSKWLMTECPHRSESEIRLALDDLFFHCAEESGGCGTYMFFDCPPVMRSEWAAQCCPPVEQWSR